jgi:hypothetical protein
MQLKQMKLYDLKPVDALIFNIVALASVQRSFRGVRNINESSRDFVPSEESNGSISRRRIAESTRISRTSVARSLDRLFEKQLVTERSRGRLQVPVGIILRGRFAIGVEELYGPIVTLFEQLLRLGVLRIAEAGTPASRIDGAQAP